MARTLLVARGSGNGLEAETVCFSYLMIFFATLTFDVGLLCCLHVKREFLVCMPAWFISRLYFQKSARHPDVSLYFEFPVDSTLCHHVTETRDSSMQRAAASR